MSHIQEFDVDYYLKIIKTSQKISETEDKYEKQK